MKKTIIQRGWNKQMITLTKPVFEKLIEHLIYIEESADSLADFYFPDSPKDREDMKRFFEQYVKTIEDEMEHVAVVKSFAEASCLDSLNTFPFVIIGSEVELVTIAGKTACVYRLIHPDSQSKVKNGVTYLSPIGKALLLKNAGSEIDIDIDMAPVPQRLKIKTITLLA